jgi:hypothetical protein
MIWTVLSESVSVMYCTLLQTLTKMRELASKGPDASGSDGRLGRMNTGGQKDTTDSEQGQQDDLGAVGGVQDRGSDGSMSDVAVRQHFFIICL